MICFNSIILTIKNKKVMKKIFAIMAVVACAIFTISCNSSSSEAISEETTREVVQAEYQLDDLSEITDCPEIFINKALSFSENGEKDVDMKITDGKQNEHRYILEVRFDGQGHYDVVLQYIWRITCYGGQVTYTHDRVYTDTLARAVKYEPKATSCLVLRTDKGLVGLTDI